MATLTPLVVSLFLGLSITPARSAVFQISSGDITALLTGTKPG